MNQRPTKYKNQYRNDSARAQWWAYGWNGAYFITICTADRHVYFGRIDSGKMGLLLVGVLPGTSKTIRKTGKEIYSINRDPHVIRQRTFVIPPKIPFLSPYRI